MKTRTPKKRDYLNPTVRLNKTTIENELEDNKNRCHTSINDKQITSKPNKGLSISMTGCEKLMQSKVPVYRTLRSTKIIEFRPSQKDAIYEFQYNEKDEPKMKNKIKKGRKKLNRKFKFPNTVTYVQRRKLVAQYKPKENNTRIRQINATTSEQADKNVIQKTNPIIKNTTPSLTDKTTANLGTVSGINMTETQTDNNVTQNIVPIVNNATPSLSDKTTANLGTISGTNMTETITDNCNIHQANVSVAQDICNDFDSLITPDKISMNQSMTFPWRTDISVPRRSTLFETKRNSDLPRYNQESVPVLNNSVYIQVPTTPKTNPIENSVRKHTRQTTLKSFLTTSLRKSNTQHHSASTSLNDSAFSVNSAPVQNIANNFTVQPENWSSLKKSALNNQTIYEDLGVSFKSAVASSPTFNHASPKPLSENNSNRPMTSTPNRMSLNKSSYVTSRLHKTVNSSTVSRNATNDDFFGFDVQESYKNKENLNTTGPQRISLTDINKVLRYKKKKNDDNKRELNVVTETITDQAINHVDVLPVESTQTVPPEHDENNIGLFEDNTSMLNNTTRSYSRPHRRKRCNSARSEQGDSPEKNKKRTKTTVRTKAQEKEANKWIRSFNSMCAEVDDFDLVIE